MGNQADSTLNPQPYKSRGSSAYGNQGGQGGRGGYSNQGGQGGGGSGGYSPYHQQNLYKNQDAEEKHHEQGYSANHNNSGSYSPQISQQQHLSRQAAAALEVFNSEAMNVCWVFWKDNVDILPRNKQKELALLLYCHMFQKIPAARRLFIRGEIDEQALKFLDMFGYLIRQLKDYESQSTLIKTLTSLGKRHKDWGVRFEYFEPMLGSLHLALSDHFKHTYTVRVKFCMEQIFTSAANVMTGQDIFSLFSNRTNNGNNQISFLISLEQCLADPTGREYLNRFLIQSFCAELVEFLKAFKDYKGSLSDTERYIAAATIVQKFLTPNAKNELNIKNVDMKHKILKKIDKIAKNKGTGKKNKSEYPQELFDDVYYWVLEQISTNSWPKFKQTIESISVKKNF